MDDYRLGFLPFIESADGQINGLTYKLVHFQSHMPGDHAHCALCWAPICDSEYDWKEKPEAEAFFCEETGCWICKKCFSDFAPQFHWKLAGIQPKVRLITFWNTYGQIFCIRKKLITKRSEYIFPLCFGFTGTIVGFPDNILHWGAGIVAIKNNGVNWSDWRYSFDSKEDYRIIQQGIIMANYITYRGYSVEEALEIVWK